MLLKLAAVQLVQLLQLVMLNNALEVGGSAVRRSSLSATRAH